MNKKLITTAKNRRGCQCDEARDEMKCKKCNKEIEYVNCHYFTQQLHPVGLGAYEVEKYYQAEIKGDGEEAYYINVPTFITALEFTDSIPDLVDSISCPECDKFPFKNNAIELYNETVDMVFMGEEQLDDTKIKSLG